MSVISYLPQWVQVLEALDGLHREATRSGKQLRRSSDARVLVELAREEQTQAQLRKQLHIDSGQLSRIIGRLQKDGFVEQLDRAGVSVPLRITSRGQTVALREETRRIDAVREYLKHHDDDALDRLLLLFGQLKDAQHRDRTDPVCKVGSVADAGLAIAFCWEAIESGFFGQVTDVARTYLPRIFAACQERPDCLNLVVAEYGALRSALWAMPLGDGLHIGFLSTEQDYIGRGLARLLVEELFERAKREGFRKVTAVSLVSENSAGFFEKLEFFKASEPAWQPVEGLINWERKV